jgi:hypothetical protein
VLLRHHLMQMPFDIAALSDPADGVPGLATYGWPLTFAEVGRLNAELQAGLEKLVREIRGSEAGAVLEIAAPPALVTFLTLAVACRTAAAVDTKSARFAFGRPGLMQALNAGTKPDFSIFFNQALARFERARQPLSSNRLRRIAHGLIANRGPLWPGSSAIGILNHNRLLLNNARGRSGHRFRFFTADQLFDGPVDGPVNPSLSLVLDEISHALVELFARVAETPQTTIIDAASEALGGWLMTVARHRAGLRRRWKKPPQALWTGTGGNHMTRLARAQVIEDGGSVTAFEHGGGGHIHRDLGAHHLHEFTLCQRFVTDTPAKANAYLHAIDPQRLPADAMPDIVPSAAGSGSLRWLDGAPSATIRKVMYVTTAFVGEIQYPLQPLLPDIVYADWQGRLIDHLVAADFDVVCKQHPEGLRRGEPLRMSRHADYIGGRFAEVRDQADAFVFDYPATTALWEAVCTRKPVLFVDLGLCDWAAEPWRLFRERCGIVSAHYDSRNLPQVETVALRSALIEAPIASPETDRFAEAYLVGEPRDEKRIR